MKRYLFIFGLVLTLSVHGQNDNRPLYQSFDVTEDSVFLPWAEGPSVDWEGTLYAVNYNESGTIGYVKPDGTHGLFVTLPEGSTGNGIRLWKNEVLLVADYTGHNILEVHLDDRSVNVLGHHDGMNQPNDLAITTDGRIYTSDPDWESGTGHVWMADKEGDLHKVAADMGTTNGIEVSPCGNYLYVNESEQRKVWVFEIQDDGALDNKQLLIDFEDYGLDGMRCDEKGNLYITRFDKGTVIMVSPEGEILHEVALKGKKPTNVAFGGHDGRTVYVTVADRGAIEAFRAEHVGRAYRMKEKWAHSE